MNDEITIRDFTIPFEMEERVVISEDRLENDFYEGTIQNLFTNSDELTLNMYVMKALVKDGKLHIIAHY